jgi:tetratricopeptide (TPR) repeat protein
MTRIFPIWFCGALLAALTALAGTSTLAQVVSNSGAMTPPSSRTGADASPLTADSSMEITNSQEANDYKNFVNISPEQLPKKIKAGENFLKKYNDSHLRAQVFSQLTILYIQAGDPEKGFTAGASAIQLNPKDVRTMGVLSQTMARSVNPGTPDATQKLAQAENYGKNVLTVAPTLTKPVGVSDEAFLTAKNEALVMAYSGLGLVDVRRGNFAEAIPDLQHAVQLDSKKDPTNAYLLGVANQNSGHYAEAAAAFSQCADAPGNLQPTCKSAAEDAQKRAASQAPASK